MDRLCPFFTLDKSKEDLIVHGNGGQSRRSLTLMTSFLV